MTAASAGGFQLGELPALSRSAIDRADVLRDDTEAHQRTWPHARLLVLDDTERASATAADGRIALEYLHGEQFSAELPADAVLLGQLDGTPYWAVRANYRTSGEEPGWRDLRTIGAQLDDTDAGLFTAAVAVMRWHRVSGFCANCGQPTEIARAGWVRRCTGCGREEYPRTDPAVICLVHDGGDQVLLARQSVWPAERYSVLAGFVEAGESMEACVAREIAEEVGVTVRDIRYLGNQPWPFPRSLMVGFAAIGDPAQPLRFTDGEIEEARWVHRDQVLAALDAGGAIPGLGLPFGTSIAFQMVNSWARKTP